ATTAPASTITSPASTPSTTADGCTMFPAPAAKGRSRSQRGSSARASSASTTRASRTRITGMSSGRPETPSSASTSTGRDAARASRCARRAPAATTTRESGPLRPGSSRETKRRSAANQSRGEAGALEAEGVGRSECLWTFARESPFLMRIKSGTAKLLGRGRGCFLVQELEHARGQVVVLLPVHHGPVLAVEHHVVVLLVG